MLKYKRKRNLSYTLSSNEGFWNQLVRDAKQKIAEAEKRIEQLKRARTTFKANAANNIPMPKAAASTDDATQSPSA